MKQELFNNKTKAEDYQRQPKQLGLYEASHEHDACGVGMLVNIQGGKSHERDFFNCISKYFGMIKSNRCYSRQHWYSYIGRIQ